MGTVPYMAPQVVLGREARRRRYLQPRHRALEMLTGSTPFRGERPETMMYAIVNQEAEPPGRRQPGIAGPLEAVVLRAIARRPGDRFASACDGRRFARAGRRRGDARAPAVRPTARETPAGQTPRSARRRLP